ncbi:MAG: GNAT family N-acetyltransferase [Vicinamibacterales bacterium]|nr:GNAT family N-acetyltransferase [Vicinamibacterales bacterium]
MGNLRFERIPVKDLYDFACRASNDPDRFHVVPISLNRARAQSRNPVAAPDDLALVVAYVDDKCVGYLGNLPCLLRRDGVDHVFNDLTTIFVDSTLRGSGAAKTLMQFLIDEKRDFYITGYNSQAEAFFRQRREWFFFAGPLVHLRVHLNPLSSAAWYLRRRFSKGPLKHAASIIFKWSRGCRSAMNGEMRYRLLRPKLTGALRNVDAQLVEQVRPLGATLVPQSNAPRISFPRSEAVVNWMIRNPWVSEDMSRACNYAFSYRRELFKYRAFELTDRTSGEYLGYTVFSVMDKDGLKILKVLDTCLVSNALIDVVFDLAMKECARWRIDALQGGAGLTACIGKHRLLTLVTRTVERGYFVHKTAENSLFEGYEQHIEFDYCDADIAYT